MGCFHSFIVIPIPRPVLNVEGRAGVIYLCFVVYGELSSAELNQQADYNVQVKTGL